MIREEDDCVGCKELGLPCLGKTCPNRHRIHAYCDRCGKERILYWYGEEQLCEWCIENIAGDFEDDLELVEVETNDF